MTTLVYRAGIVSCAALLGAGLLAMPRMVSAQAAAGPASPPPGFTSRQVLVSPITDVDSKQMVLVTVTLAPRASTPAHRHPGDCFGNLIEGTIELRVQGQEPRRLEAGQSYAVLGGVPHEFTNVGEQPVRMLNVWLVDKGKPPSSPASGPVR